MFNFQTYMYAESDINQKVRKILCRYMMGVQHRYFDRHAHFRSLNEFVTLAFGSINVKYPKNPFVSMVRCASSLSQYVSLSFLNETHKFQKKKKRT